MFTKNKDEKSLVYDIPEELTQELAESLGSDVKKEMETNPKLEAIVFNTDNQLVSYKGFKILSQLAVAQKRPKLQMYVLTQLKATITLIKSEGMDIALKPVETLFEVPQRAVSAAKPTTKLDVSFINPFIEGAIKTLDVQCQVTVTIDKPLLKTKDTKLPVIDILGIIGITSKTFNGNISICFPEKVFLFIMSKMLGEDYIEITKDLEDGAGEILNMIFGHAKRVLNENGHSFEKAIPAIVRAKDLSVSHLSDQGSIVLPFKSEAGEFFMEISINNGHPS
ncbi:MAG: hypothetical protein B7Y39_04070 [Bdellovibrio sp. 28-41-41]|nr:MAG: hypothetical protein B7Y39_04070 [Bdellovibrio sp. 28-41-41]